MRAPETGFGCWRTSRSAFAAVVSFGVAVPMRTIDSRISLKPPGFGNKKLMQLFVKASRSSSSKSASLCGEPWWSIVAFSHASRRLVNAFLTSLYAIDFSISVSRNERLMVAAGLGCCCAALLLSSPTRASPAIINTSKFERETC